MDFRILGPLEVDDGEGRPVDLGGRQQRVVLAMLLVHRREVVSVDRLIDALWGERPPAAAVKNVQIHVSRLRKALQAGSPDGGEREGVLRTRANGYALEVAPGELDADRFEGLVEDGRRALAAGEAQQADAALRNALALWRGPPLADFTYDSFAQGDIERLEELRLGAIEERIDADLALGRHGEVTSELLRLVAEHPLRERLRGQLMLALHRAGRKADALRVYDEARRQLAEELGLEPSESLRRLHSAVLADDPALAAPSRVPERSRAPGATPAAPLLAGRHRVLIAVGGVLLLGAALAAAVLAVTRDRTSAGLVGVGANSLAQIDPDTNRVVAEIPVGARPATVVFAEGALWVANLDDDTVSRVDPKASRVVRTIPIGAQPGGLAGGHGAVWAIGGDGLLRRIDPAFNEVTNRIETAKAGTIAGGTRVSGSVATTDDAVWAVSGGFLSAPRLFRIDPATRRGSPVVATGGSPTAMAFGFGDLWVTDSFENTVSRIDPIGFVADAFPVGRGAGAVAVGDGAVWVANSLDDTVLRVDPETGVATPISVGRHPAGIAVGAGAAWVANRQDATVSRIDTETNEVVETIEVGPNPTGIAFAAGSVWVTSQTRTQAGAARADGMLRIGVSQGFETDPALFFEAQANYATCAKLLNHPDAPAPAGTRLVPEVAASLPALSADGRTYTFTIRDGFGFSPPSREPVTAETFKFSIERSLRPNLPAGFFVSDIVGLAAYQSGRAEHISGVVADGDKLSITLARPAPDFLARIAMPQFCAVPLNTPFDPNGVRAIPSAGPYYIAEEEPEQRIVLKRNPNYGGSRPQGPREIHYAIGVQPARSVADVEAGRADYTWQLPADPAAEAELAARYGPGSAAAREGRQRYFVNTNIALGYLALNTSRPLFSQVRLRKAVNYAIDRRALARLGHLRLTGGDFPAVPTDQYLPPSMPGSSRTPLYPLGGDLRTARRLAPDARGTAVLYTCDLRYCRRQAQVIKSNLKALGLEVDVKEFPFFELFERAGTRGEPFDILAAHWIADYADPSAFLNALLDQDITRDGNLNISRYTDPQLRRKLEQVARLSGEARYRAYAALSVDLARDAAPWVAYATGTWRELFSARVGCQVFQPVVGSMDLGALCIRN